MLSVLLVLATLAAAPLEGAESFLRGADAQRAGDYAAATTHFLAAEAAGDALRPYAMLRVASCREASGDVNGAITLCRQVLQAFPEGPWVAQAESQLYTIHTKRDGAQFSITLGESFLNVPVTPWWLDSVAWEHSETLLKTPGKEDGGYAFFRGIIENSIYPDKRLQAARKLVASPSLEDRGIAVMGMMRSNGFEEASRVLLSSPAVFTGPAGDAIGLADMAALLDTTAGPQRDEALARVARDNAENLWMRLWLAHTVRAQGTLGDYDRAIRAGEVLIELYPEDRETGDALWWLAQRIESKQNFDAAVPVYERLIKGCPTQFRAANAALHIADTELARGRRVEAAAAYERLGDTFLDSRHRDYAYYKGAQLASAAGNESRAQDKLQKAAGAGVGRFYAHRALDRLGRDGGRNLKVDGSRPVLQVMPEAQAPIPPTPALFRESLQYKRLQFFGRYGLDEGEWEALDLLRRLGADPGQEIFYQPIAEAGFAHTALQFASHHGWGGDGLEKSPARMRLELPRAYWQDAIALGRETGVDPYLMLAVAKQESTYRATVQSHAGATGVMQLMPNTAKWLVDVEDGIHQEHYANLKSPANSLRLGAFYLRRMINTYDGNLVYAIAAYNGGPGNVNKWRKQNPTSDLDAWIESIPYTETRDYVRKVLGYYAAYHSLYPMVEF
jgi:tetratricopeptide (TPR) repeat protein